MNLMQLSLTLFNDRNKSLPIWIFYLSMNGDRIENFIFL